MIDYKRLRYLLPGGFRPTGAAGFKRNERIGIFDEGEGDGERGRIVGSKRTFGGVIFLVELDGGRIVEANSAWVEKTSNLKDPEDA